MLPSSLRDTQTDVAFWTSGNYSVTTQETCFHNSFGFIIVTQCLYLNPRRPVWVTKVNRSVEVSTGMNKGMRELVEGIEIWYCCEILQTAAKPALSLFPLQSLPIPLSHSLRLSPSSPASLLLPSHPSLSLPSVCHTFPPSFSSLSRTFSNFSLSLSISLYRWTWMQNTVCWVHLGVSAVWRGANQSAALQSHSFSWISTLRSLISTYIKTTSRSYAISLCIGMLYIICLST